jgi:hypothetical protein
VISVRRKSTSVRRTWWASISSERGCSFMAFLLVSWA